ncbi:MAG: hypothetical protein IIU86_05350 [Oscillospiraceae bacterium]|nr:hypothetical protein [Oscillospiraceae bacterium]
MKKLMALLLVMTVALTMAACGRSKKNTAALAGTMEENINKIMQANPTEFMGGVTVLDLKDTTEDGKWALKNFTGLDSADKITDAAVYEPMTGSQAFSLVLVRVADAADAKPVAQQMKDNINPAKWICVSADQVMAAGYGDTVLFIMLDSNMGKTAQSYVDAFKNVCGGEPDFTI